MPFDHSGLEILGDAECWALLESAPLGRIVFTDRALPAIQPVNFALSDGDVIIRTSPGSKLAAATRGAIVAFEADDFDTATRTGWSVVAVGPARTVTDPHDLTALQRLPLRPWVPTACDHFIRIRPEILTGRRIPAKASAPLPAEGAGPGRSNRDPWFAIPCRVLSGLRDRTRSTNASEPARARWRSPPASDRRRRPPMVCQARVPRTDLRAAAGAEGPSRTGTSAHGRHGHRGRSPLQTMLGLADPGGMEIDGSGLEVLGDAESLALIQSVPIGRVVFTEQALPAVQPVNFVVDGDSVVIRTALGSKFAAATRGAIVAFETDDFDPVTGTGWSVTAVGQARAVRDPKEIARLSRLPLQPWSPGPKDHFIRISCHRLTGRRIVPVAPGNGGQAA